jgi:hypothetical protein
MTCCALHNCLLEIDGLDYEWQGGVPSDWEAEFGLHDLEDATRYVPVAALARFNARQFTARHYDVSGMGPGEDRDTIEETKEDESGTNVSTTEHGFYVENATVGGHIVNGVCIGGVRIVQKLPRDFFRRKLLEHHDILCRQGNKLKWPRLVPK